MDVDAWPGAPRGGESELAELCARLRAHVVPPADRVRWGRFYIDPDGLPVPDEPPLPFERRHPRPRPGHGTVFLHRDPASGRAEASWQDEDGIEGVEGHLAPVEEWARSRPAQRWLVLAPDASDWVDLEPTADT
jgi:hypothetical protein